MPTNDKLAAAAHLVIARLPPHQLGATKLNKILWFADCENFRRHGKSLTGVTTYVRRAQGPCPQGIETTLVRLRKSGAIVETLQPVIHYHRRELVAVEPPPVDAFTAEEVDILLGTALEFAGLSAQEVSDLSHDDLWEGTDPNGEMTVEAGSVQFLPPTPDDVAWASRAFAAE